MDSIYGLSTNGQFHSININNAAPSAAMLGGDTAVHAINSNGLGYSVLTGRFYFFNRVANGDSIEFVSYNPVTRDKQFLAKPPVANMTAATTDKVRSGTVDNSGTGFYTILTNKPSTAATFFYYNIPTNTWKVIAQSFKDTLTGNSLDSQFHNLNSGDMTFDGAGNLWIVASKSPKYAIYKVKAPVTTNAVAKLAVSIMVPTRSMPRASSAASFTGVAFNSAGDLYLTTGSNSAMAVGLNLGPGNDYNILYKIANLSPLTVDSIGRLPNSYGDDLTSCSYPQYVLPVSWLDFKADFQNKSVNLSWKIIEDKNTSGYDVESSTDGEHWDIIGHNNSGNPGNAATEKEYNYTDKNYKTGANYYRIVQYNLSGKTSISGIKQINIVSAGKIYLGPNPAKDKLYIYNKENTAKYLAQVFDKSGRLLSSVILDQLQQTINISRLPVGSYILRLSSSSFSRAPESLQFIKL
ncbi:MAG: T9SS type A sorting domain-containing protein [Bacteroidota bacterium]